MAVNILVFDSGLGGLSIVKALSQRQIDANVFYLADKSHYPYGELEAEVITSRCLSLLQQQLSQQAIDLIIVACNTASTQTLPLLRQHLAIPIVGVVPAIKPAAALSQTRHIALLATPATVKTDYIQQLQDEFASHCQLHKVASSELVHLAEQKLIHEQDVSLLVQHALAELLEIDAPIDTLILGCTHFPLISHEIALALNVRSQAISLLDSGGAIAKRVASLVPQAPVGPTKLICASFSYLSQQQYDAMHKAFSHFGFAMVKTC